MYIANTNSILYFVVGSLALHSLSKKAASRTQTIDQAGLHKNVQGVPGILHLHESVYSKCQC